jgi:ABC-2 type transport system ATP-binding protein
VIKFENTSKAFRRNVVLSDINLTIGRHDRVALVGSNGAGKTTLIRCLLGEYTCGGAVFVNGMSPHKQRPDVLGRIGFVPQLPPPLRMPVGQLIQYSARLCDSTPQRIEAVTTALKLDIRRIWRQPFVRLSGGQKQKLLIGIALGRDVECLVLDEPAANLDPDARHAFFGLLAGKQADTAMLISSHRLDDVAALVNRVVELDLGRVVLDEQVVDTVDMSSRMLCKITLSRAGSAIENTLRSWGFVAAGDSLDWRGTIPGSDRLRFIGMLSRYTALLDKVRMEAEERLATLPAHQEAISAIGQTAHLADSLDS